MSNNDINQLDVDVVQHATQNDAHSDTPHIVNEYNMNPSICIPRVFVTISVCEIINIFQNKLNIGPIKKVDVVHNKNYRKINENTLDDNTLDDKNTLTTHQINNKFKKVFIHFKYWNEDEHIQSIRTMLNQGKTIKVVYDCPWFWKCSLNRSSSD